MNEPVKDPSAIEQVSEAIELASDIEQAESLVENPAPDTCTVDPTDAEAGLREMVSVLLLTMKVAETESSAGLPEAMTV